jgi:hypothetical protein
LFEGGVGNLLNAGGFFDIAGERENLNAQLSQFLCGPFAALFFARAEHQVRAHFRQAFGHLPAEADGTAGNDRDASGEIEDLAGFHFIGCRTEKFSS